MVQYLFVLDIQGAVNSAGHAIILWAIAAL